MRQKTGITLDTDGLHYFDTSNTSRILSEHELRELADIIKELDKNHPNNIEFRREFIRDIIFIWVILFIWIFIIF